MTGARSFAQLLFLLFLYFMSTRLLQTLVETLQAKLLFGISLKMRWKWLFFCDSLFFCWNTTPPSWHNKFVHQDICSWFNLGGHFCGLPKHLAVTVFCLLLELHTIAMQCMIQNAFWSKHAVQILKLMPNYKGFLFLSFSLGPLPKTMVSRGTMKKLWALLNLSVRIWIFICVPWQS